MTAAPEVLTALLISGLPQEAQAFVAAVSEGEVPMVWGQSAFNILYSGGTPVDPGNPLVDKVGSWRYWTGGLSAFPAWGGAKLGNGLISTAAGALQITHTTFEGESGFGITTFLPQSQIVFGWKLAQGVFSTRSGQPLLGVLQGPSSGLPMIPAYLIKTWPGGCGGGFPKRFTANLATLRKLTQQA